MKKLLIGALLGVLVLPINVQAAVFMSGEDIATAERLDEDLFAAANRVIVKNEVAQDAWLAGANVEVEAPVAGDVTALGERVTIKADVGDDVMVAGQWVNISGKADDVFVAGEAVRLSGEISGDVYAASAQAVVVDPGTKIAGDVYTFGPIAPSLGEGVEIAGEQIHRITETPDHEMDMAAVASAMVMGILAWLIVVLVVAYVFGGVVDNVLAFTRKDKSFVITALIGFVWVIATLPAFFLLIISGVGIPLAFVALLVTLMAGLLAYVSVVALVGQWLHGKFTGKATEKVYWLPVLIGLVAIALLKLVPVVGGLAVFVLCLYGLGAVFRCYFPGAKN